MLAARSSHFTAAYAGIGLTPDGGMSWMLPRLVGLRRAQEMMLTNTRLAAEDAAAIGLGKRAGWLASDTGHGQRFARKF